jgi:hypothetical protein
MNRRSVVLEAEIGLVDLRVTYDTSVWIDVFRKREPLDIEALVDLDEVVTCLPVVQEVLQGFRDERAFRLAREAMLRSSTILGPPPFWRGTGLHEPLVTDLPRPALDEDRGRE